MDSWLWAVWVRFPLVSKFSHVSKLVASWWLWDYQCLERMSDAWQAGFQHGLDSQCHDICPMTFRPWGPPAVYQPEYLDQTSSKKFMIKLDIRNDTDGWRACPKLRTRGVRTQCSQPRLICPSMGTCIIHSIPIGVSEFESKPHVKTLLTRLHGLKRCTCNAMVDE